MPAPRDFTNAQQNVAMTSPAQLKAWLQATGRKYLVINAVDLVDAIAFPDGVELLMQCLAAYRDLRRTKPTGLTEVIPVRQKDGSVQQQVADVMQGEFLEPEEAAEAQEQIKAQTTELLKGRGLVPAGLSRERLDALARDLDEVGLFRQETTEELRQLVDAARKVVCP